jgi:hypothetical protein
MNMFFYVVHGFGIHSELPLPELLADETAPPDIVIRRGAVDQRLGQGAATGSVWTAGLDEVCYHRANVGSCLIREGRQIIVDVAAGADQRLLHHLILSVALGIAMHQSGRVVLHASAVSLGDRAVLFVARSCGGKSTTAAALHAWGYGLVADDVVAVHVPETEAPLVFPAFAEIRMCSEAAAFLGYDSRRLSPVHSLDERLRYRDGETFRNRPLSPAAVYILAAGTREVIEPLRPREAFLELVRYTQPTLTEMLAATGTAPVHFHRCARLAQCVPVRRLTRRMHLEALGGVRLAVEEDLSALLADEAPFRSPGSPPPSRVAQ